MPEKSANELLEPRRSGVFDVTPVAAFIGVLTDRAQIAGVTSAARFQNGLSVMDGATAGRVVSGAPAVFVGTSHSKRTPIKRVHGIEAAIFAGIGVATSPCSAG